MTGRAAQKAESIKLVALDVDGVMTDGTLFTAPYQNPRPSPSTSRMDWASSCCSAVISMWRSLQGRSSKRWRGALVNWGSPRSFRAGRQRLSA